MAQTRSIAFKTIYVDMANDDIEAGLLLSQIVYWHLPSQDTGKTKLRVQKEGNLWLAKGREDWFEEIRLKPKRVDKAMKILVDNGLVEKKTFKFNANPTTHVRILWDNFLALYDEKLHSQALAHMVIPKTGKTIFPNEEKGNVQNGKNDIPKTGITLTDIKNIDNNIDNITKTNNSLSPMIVQLTTDILETYDFTKREINEILAQIEFEEIKVTKSNLIAQCKYMQNAKQEIRLRVPYFIRGLKENEDANQKPQKQLKKRKARILCHFIIGLNNRKKARVCALALFPSVACLGSQKVVCYGSC
jgi:hypothetical protein